MSVILGILAANTATKYTRIPGIRNLNSRSIAIISQNVTKIGLVLGATALDEYFDLDAKEKINGIANDVADRLVDDLFDAFN